MSRPAAGGGGTGNITLDMIRTVRPECLRSAGRSLTTGATNLDTSHGEFTGNVQNPLCAGHAWAGAGQPQASSVISGNASKITGVAQRLRPASTVLNGFADFLDGAKVQVSQIDQSAAELDATVSPTGDVTVNEVPGEPTDEYDRRSARAGELLGQARGVLMATNEADGHAAGTLNRLQQGDPTKPPPLEALHLDYWQQNFTDAKFWAIWISTAAATIPAALRDGALKFAASARAQAVLASLATPTIAESARHAAIRSYGKAVDMQHSLSRLGPAAEWTTKGLPTSTKFLSKVPYVGWAATGLGVGLDRSSGESWGQAVASNVVPTLAGTAATTGALAVLSVAGGPATLIAVGAGLGVAYGVGYVIDHWGGISEGIGDATDAVGDAVGNGVEAVGDLFRRE